MLREETVFGPIHSRRLGSSLGINLLPRQGKICNFDCIYCECGWNKDGRDDKVLPTAAQVRSALEDKLAACMLEGTPIDSITFSGDGEPTLNPEFPRIIDDTLQLRDARPHPGGRRGAEEGGQSHPEDRRPDGRARRAHQPPGARLQPGARD